MLDLESAIRFHTEEAEIMKLHKKVNEIILGAEAYKRELQEHTQTAEWLRELQETRKERDYWQEKAHSYEQTIFKLTDAISKQPEIIRCGECVHYDPPHVENEGVRYEYSEMPKEAFDVLGTGLVSVEYGINVGGRCCVDYYCKNYPDDKRVYVPKDNYCGRAERRTDG